MDYESISHFSQAFWSDRRYSLEVSQETLTAVTQFESDHDKILDRTFRALLERARRDSGARNTQTLNHPFFRLSTEERFILVGLHSAHWSYERLGKILVWENARVAQTAWRARVDLGTSVGIFPRGPGKLQPDCPEYDDANPWTQRLFDQAVSHTEELFIKNHAQKCVNCKAALQSFRELFYGVEPLIPKNADLATYSKSLERAVKKTARFSVANRHRFWPSFLHFLVKPRNLLWISAGVLLWFLLR